MLHKSYNLYVQGYNQVINNSYLCNLHLKVSKFYGAKMLTRDFHQSSWSLANSCSVWVIHVQFKVKPPAWTSALGLAFLTYEDLLSWQNYLELMYPARSYSPKSDRVYLKSVFLILTLKTSYSNFLLKPKTLPFGHIPLKSILCQWVEGASPSQNVPEKIDIRQVDLSGSSENQTPKQELLYERFGDTSCGG